MAKFPRSVDVDRASISIGANRGLPGSSATWAGRQCEQWASNYHWAVRTYGSGGYQGPWNN